MTHSSSREEWYADVRREVQPMGTRLRHPPLVEALVEFRFAPDRWDWTIPGRLYEQLEQEFPQRQEVRPLTVPFPSPPFQPPPPPVLPAPERIQFKRRDGTAMVQSGPGLLVINHLQEYPTWETFRQLVVEVYEKHLSIAGDIPLTRIGMRYINHIGEQWLGSGKKISVVAPVDKILGGDVRDFYQRYDVRFDEPHGFLVHQCGTGEVGRGRGIMLDLDFASTELPQQVSTNDLCKWLEGAHARIEEAFQKSLSEELFSALKGEEAT
jgi:uncharacterized protein (TIGR04255 family)